VQKNTFGDMLLELACGRRSFDGFYGDAINELAISWLESGKFGQDCPNPNVVKAAVRNKMRDLYRAYRYHLDPEEQELAAPGSNTDDLLSVREEFGALEASVSGEDFTLLCLDGMGFTGPELGARLGIANSNARQRLCRLRVSLGIAA
jgi:hypothetical protein